ncbi:MAG: hypothetical protein ACI9DF_003472 [Verrucomicrobiales bacterium]|jgi:hypothetical protein
MPYQQIIFLCFIAGLTAALAESSHWSFQPLKVNTPPPGETHPIDAFVSQKLEIAGLSMSAEAERETLIRRLYLVMLGVPPEPSEIDAFVSAPPRQTNPGVGWSIKCWQTTATANVGRSIG